MLFLITRNSNKRFKRALYFHSKFYNQVQYQQHNLALVQRKTPGFKKGIRIVKLTQIPTEMLYNCGILQIFAGNTNAYNIVRNNFVTPTIQARYIRVYPRLGKIFPQGLKVALTGCDLEEGKYVVLLFIYYKI